MKYALFLIVLCFYQAFSDKQQTVIDLALQKVGAPYVLGMYGNRLTEQKLKELVNRFGADQVHPEKARKYLNKICYDCAGLVANVFKQVGISLSTGANSAWTGTSWAQSGTIDQMPKDKVVILYRYGKGRMQHTGIYIKGNQVVHAKGIDYGVVKDSFSSSWTHYGIPKNFIDDVTPTPTPTGLQVGDTVKIIGTGNGSSYGDSNTAGGIGWTRQILKIWDGRPFPYQVGNSTGTTGFYKESSLQKI